MFNACTANHGTFFGQNNLGQNDAPRLQLLLRPPTHFILFSILRDQKHFRLSSVGPIILSPIILSPIIASPPTHFISFHVGGAHKHLRHNKTCFQSHETISAPC